MRIINVSGHESTANRVVIRPSVFETNSSSEHSICVIRPKKQTESISEEDRKTIIMPYAKKTSESRIRFTETFRIDLTETLMTHSYHWGFDLLSSFIDKLGYVYCSLYHGHQTFKELLLDAIGVPECAGFITLDPPPSIDHQSAYVVQEYIEGASGLARLRNLLFDDDYFIVIDNDNRDPDYEVDYYENTPEAHGYVNWEVIC